jgi:DNA-binding XRE family transcriptional regulator
MTTAEVKAARAKLGASQSQFAELVGVSLKVVLGWEAGAYPPPTSWQAVLIRALTLSPNAGEIVRVLQANGLACAYAMGLEAALTIAAGAASDVLAAQRPAKMPVTTTARTAEASR